MFLKKNIVYIDYKNIKTKQLSNKLDYIWISLFSITEVLGKVIYKVKLLTYIRIYLVFYVL